MQGMQDTKQVSTPGAESSRAAWSCFSSTLQPATTWPSSLMLTASPVLSICWPLMGETDGACSPEFGLADPMTTCHRRTHVLPCTRHNRSKRSLVYDLGYDAMNFTCFRLLASLCQSTWQARKCSHSTAAFHSTNHRMVITCQQSLGPGVHRDQTNVYHAIVQSHAWDVQLGNWQPAEAHGLQEPGNVSPTLRLAAKRQCNAIRAGQTCLEADVGG